MSRSPRTRRMAMRSATGKAGVMLSHLGPGLDERDYRRCDGCSRFDPDGGNCRRHSYLLLRAASASGNEPAPGCRPMPDVSSFLQARLSSGTGRRSAAHRGAGVSSCADRAARARCSSTFRWICFRPIWLWTLSIRSRRKLRRPAIDAAVAERIVQALADAKNPVLYAGAACSSARATAELAALAEALELPVAHTLMGKGCMHEDHPLLLGMTGFWGTPIANEKCRTADLILAVGTRLAEANSSSWYPRVHFRNSAHAADSHRCRPCRDRAELSHGARRGRRCQTGARPRWRQPRKAASIATVADLREEIAHGRRGFRGELGARMDFRPVSDAAGADPERTAKSPARRWFHCDRRGLE